MTLLLVLVTPGPDVSAEGRDHTLGAAITKAVGKIENKLEDRAHKILRGLRGNGQTPACFRRGRRH